MVHADLYASKTEAFPPVNIAAKIALSVSFHADAIVSGQNIERLLRSATTSLPHGSKAR
tara:strand:+ start:464 stop:640 length:177 start_codon:yes stop_codon:yes gene_type:complete